MTSHWKAVSRQNNFKDDDSTCWPASFSAVYKEPHFIFFIVILKYFHYYMYLSCNLLFQIILIIYMCLSHASMLSDSKTDPRGKAYSKES